MKKREIILMVVFLVWLFCLPRGSCAETILLKTGQTIEGSLIERTDKCIKISFQGVPVTYFFDEIDAIDGMKVVFPPPQGSGLSEQAGPPDVHSVTFEITESHRARIIKECVNNSKKARSYHVSMFFRTTKDNETQDKNFDTVDLIIDYVKPDRFSVEQYYKAKNWSDKWITIGSRTYRFYNFFWIEASMKIKQEQNALKLNKKFLLDNYFEVLSSYEPADELGDKNTLILSYQPDNSSKFYEAWGFKKIINCLLKVWINIDSKLIGKTFIQIRGIDITGQETGLEIWQEFSNYNGNIVIDKPRVKRLN